MKKTFLIVTLLISVSFFAQNEKVDRRISDKACDCISKIDTNIKHEFKGDSIKNCIQTSILGVRVLESMLNTKKEDNIIALSDEEINDVEGYLLENCKSLKYLLMTNDEVGIDTFTKDKKAKEFYNKGEEEFSRSNYKAAIKNYEKAVKIDPNFAFAWDNMGVSYRKIEKFEKAIECYKKSLEIDPKGHMPLLNVAIAYELLNNPKEALKAYESFKIVYPEDPEGFYGIGRMSYLLKNYENSMENLLSAYTIYQKTNSPYIQHAVQVISMVYTELVKEEKLDFIKSMENKYKVNFN